MAVFWMLTAVLSWQHPPSLPQRYPGSPRAYLVQAFPRGRLVLGRCVARIVIIWVIFPLSFLLNLAAGMYVSCGSIKPRFLRIVPWLGEARVPRRHWRPVEASIHV